MPISRSASASSSDRLVIPWTTSTVVSPSIVRSRVISNARFIPAHFWRSVSIVVVRNVRLSSRPCPLSADRATRPGTGAMGSGGKSRGPLSGHGVVGEPGLDVYHQARLIVLGE
jgi:hypothetical protein